MTIQSMGCCLQESKLAALRDKYNKTKEKNDILKSNNQVLTDQVAGLKEEVAENESKFKRTERQLRMELSRVEQERDGYSEQMVCLRDKISGLARDLAETEDAVQKSKATIARLESELEQAETDHKAAARAWKNDRLLLCQVWLATKPHSGVHFCPLPTYRHCIQHIGHPPSAVSVTNATCFAMQERDGFESQVEWLLDTASHGGSSSWHRRSSSIYRLSHHMLDRQGQCH